MERVMIVQQVEPDGIALLCPERKSCQGSCQTCPGRAREERLRRFRATNPVGAKEGDRVLVKATRSSAIKTAIRMYVLPVVLFLTCYILGENLWGQGPLAGMGSLVLALFLGTVYDRLVYRKKTRFTIVDFAPKG